MRTLTKAALLALALAGAAGSANAAGIGFYVGPDGAHIGYTQGYYYDRYHHRHMYRYPTDWRTYHHPLGWYREHRYWYRDGDDWYRR